ncbi:hypothetical protein ES703_78078 [subsurface metagenome]
MEGDAARAEPYLYSLRSGTGGWGGAYVPFPGLSGIPGAAGGAGGFCHLLR